MMPVSAAELVYEASFPKLIEIDQNELPPYQPTRTYGLAFIPAFSVTEGATIMLVREIGTSDQLDEAEILRFRAWIASWAYDHA
jgi:hypothetical protein